MRPHGIMFLNTTVLMFKLKSHKMVTVFLMCMSMGILKGKSSSYSSLPSHYKTLEFCLLPVKKKSVCLLVLTQTLMKFFTYIQTTQVTIQIVSQYQYNLTQLISHFTCSTLKDYKCSKHQNWNK